MEFWIDTSDIAAIEKAAKLGILYGVTTNPSIFSKAKEPAEKFIDSLLQIQEGLVALQVTQVQSCESMVKQAKEIASISPRIVIKIPATPAGFAAISQLKQEGVPTLATAISSVGQFTFAALAGADYAALYLQHMQQGGQDIYSEIEKMLRLARQRGWSVKLMGAAFADATAVQEVISLGVPAVTVPAGILEDLLQLDPLVIKQLEQFASDWKGYQQQYDSGLLRCLDAI